MKTIRGLTVTGTVVASANVAAACPAGLRALPRGQADMSQVRAVAISPPVGSMSGVLRFSGVHVAGHSYVMDVQMRRNGTPGKIVRGSVTPSLPPVISNLQATIVGEDVVACGTEFPDRVQLTFDYEDCDGDLLGGVAGATTTMTLGGGGAPVKGAVVWRFFGSIGVDIP
jgi:hypothetical protein